MAALTWRDVAAPSLGNPQDSINSAAKLLAASTGGMSGALTQFGDQQALQQLAQYSDAQKLQADIQSGRFNTANASAAALSDVMNRPAALLTNASNQQTFDYNAQKNPLELSRMGIANATSQEALNQSRLTNPYVANALERADALGAYGQANKLAEVDQTTAKNARTFPQELLTLDRTNAETNRLYPIQESARQAQEQLAILQNQGQLPSPVEGNAYFQQLVNSGAHPVVLNAVKGMLEQSFGKGAIGAVSTSAGGSVPSPVAGVLNNAAASGNGTSVGERNNNQGNLMGTGWVTEMPGYLGNDEKGFAKFASNEQGTAANNRQLERYWEGTQATGGKPVRTIDGIINTWAPPETGTNKTGNSAESVANYKKYVQTRTGIDMTKELTKEQLGPVRAAMQEFETGNVSKTPIAADPAASTSLVQAAKPIAGEVPDISTLRRKFQTLTQQSTGVGAQDATNFNAAVLAGMNQNMDQAAAFDALRKEPAFANVHESTLVAALNKAQEKSGLSDFGPLLPAIRRSLSGDTEWNMTKGAPWRTGTFDYDKLEKFSQQAGDLPKVIKSAEGAQKRKDDLATVAYYMPQIEALNTERIGLYQQQQLGKPGAAAALAKVDERIKGYTAIVNPLISTLDKELNARVKNSPETEEKLRAQAIVDAKKLADDAASAEANKVAEANKAASLLAKPTVGIVPVPEPKDTYDRAGQAKKIEALLQNAAVTREAEKAKGNEPTIAIIARTTSAKGLDYSTLSGMSKAEAQAIKNNPRIYNDLKPLLAKLIDSKV